MNILSDFRRANGSERVFKNWVVEALISLKGEARIVDIAKEIWRRHKQDIDESDDLFYTWQYDMRWAATRLRKEKILKPKHESPKGTWQLAKIDNRYNS